MVKLGLVKMKCVATSIHITVRCNATYTIIKTAIDAAFTAKSEGLSRGGLKDSPQFFQTFQKGLSNFNANLTKEKVVEGEK